MKVSEVLAWTMTYFSIDLLLGQAINYHFNLEINFIEIVLIDLFFSIILVFLLVFDVPERIVNKIISRKEKVVIYNIQNNLARENEGSVGELLEILDKDNKIGGESNESKI